MYRGAIMLAATRIRKCLVGTLLWIYWALLYKYRALLQKHRANV